MTAKTRFSFDFFYYLLFLFTNYLFIYLQKNNYKYVFF